MKSMKKILPCLMLFITLLIPLNTHAATKLANMSGKQIIKSLKDNGFPISNYVIYTTNRTDPNHLIGKPSQYKCKVDFWDEDYFDEFFADDFTGTIEIFKNSADATRRKKYIQAIYDAAPSWAHRMYQYSNVLLRIDYGVPAKRLKYYKNAFSDMQKGKIPKFPLSISKKKLALDIGDKKTLKLNVSAKKAKWKSSNKKIATVSSKGVVTAKKAGKVTITASYNGYKVKCTVTVAKENNSSATPLSGVRISTVDWYENGDDVTFKIENTSSETMVISKDATAYDDNYKKIGEMKMPFADSVSILPGESKNVTFLDFSFSGIIYYTQRIVFSFNIGNKAYKCYAEYNYRDDAPYDFSFHM